MFHRTVIPELNITLTRQENILSEYMVGYWTSFARNGVPDNGTLSWPSWNVAVRENILFGETVTTESTKQLCDMWDKLGYDY